MKERFCFDASGKFDDFITDYEGENSNFLMVSCSPYLFLSSSLSLDIKIIKYVRLLR